MFKIQFFVFHQVRKQANQDWLPIQYLAAAVKQLDEVCVSFTPYIMDSSDKALQEMVDNPADMLALLVLPDNYMVSMDFINRVHEKLPDLHVTIFGREGSLNPIFMMEMNNGLQSIIIGEGEETIVELAKRLIHNISLEDCNGICFRQNEKIILNKSRALQENLDKFCFPDRSIINRTNHTFFIIASRGCQGCCTFCDGSSCDGASYYPNSRARSRCRSMENLLDEITLLVNEYKAKFIHFNDSTFCGSDDRQTNQ